MEDSMFKKNVNRFIKKNTPAIAVMAAVAISLSGCGSDSEAPEKPSTEVSQPAPDDIKEEQTTEEKGMDKEIISPDGWMQTPLNESHQDQILKNFHGGHLLLDMGIID